MKRRIARTQPLWRCALEFEWDDAKAKSNRAKHGVSFEEAAAVIEGRYAITVPDVRHSDAEEREITIGLSLKSRLLYVVHTARDAERIRLISARRATSKERELYEEALKDVRD
ncbi:MAG: BrnT family toxin [Tepidisphaeraceae bacterium]